ncbi:MAG: hypothetical protein ABI488_25815 [Polyangiaceae bacterium]
MRNSVMGLVGLGTLFLFSACGGSSNDSSSSCATASACGGDVVGTWKVSSSCITADASSMMGNMSCSGLTESTSATVTGTITYAADKTYTSSFTTSGSVVVKVPASCLMQQGVTLTCQQVQQALSVAATSGFASATCAESGGGCACTLGLNAQPTTETGTYSTAASVLTETDAGGTPSDSDYCVKGSTLTVSPHPGSSTSSGVSGSVVLSKQ